MEENLGTISNTEPAVETVKIDVNKIEYRKYESEEHLDIIMRMIKKELSEPYPIFTYRYFVKNWPELTFLAYYPETQEYIGCAVSKLETKKVREPILQTREAQANGGCIIKSGYVAMLAVIPKYRGNGLGKLLVIKSVEAMEAMNADEVVLETEVTNKAALYLYQSLGFIREKRLINYYLNSNDAFKLILFLKLIV